MGCAAFGGRLVEIVFNRSIRAAFDQKLDHCHIPVLRRYVKGRNPLSVRESAKCPFAIDVSAVIQQPCNGLRAITRGSPDERRAPIRIGIQLRARFDELIQHCQAVALARPTRGPRLKSLADRLKVANPGNRYADDRNLGRRKLGESGRRRVGNRRPPTWHAKPGSSAKIVRSDRMPAQQVGHFAMPPKQRDN